MVDTDANRLESYQSGGHLKVDGWGVDEFLISFFRVCDAFQKQRNISGPLFEIGVHQGRTLILLAMLSKQNEKVVGLDLFEAGQEQNIDFSGSGSMANVNSNIQEFTPEVEVELISGNSFDFRAHPIFEDLRGARICHIDGGHFFEVVLNDLDLCQNIIGVGGVICIDDYFHSGFPEVQEAVHRYFWSSSVIKAVPFAAGNNKLFLIGSSYYRAMLDYIKEEFKDTGRGKPIKILGYEAVCIDEH